MVIVPIFGHYGLSIARGMTERMGGSITFETSTSSGTKFHLDFLSSDG
jgi:signal transduction histidine kinase